MRSRADILVVVRVMCFAPRLHKEILDFIPKVHTNQCRIGDCNLHQNTVSVVQNEGLAAFSLQN
jgi:hypothetical protein